MSDGVEQFSAERIADRMRIEHVMYRWCRAVDRLDKAGMLSVFHPDAIDSHGPYIGPADGLVDWILERHRGITFSSHFLGNMLIEFVTEDLALVETYVRTNQRYPAHAKAQIAQFTGGESGSDGREVDVFTNSRYLDRFERRNGEWRIARRTVIQDWKALHDVEVDALQPKPGWVIGRRDDQDALWLERRELGLPGL